MVGVLAQLQHPCTVTRIHKNTWYGRPPRTAKRSVLNGCASVLGKMCGRHHIASNLRLVPILGEGTAQYLPVLFGQ
jgi:hypothetical protein